MFKFLDNTKEFDKEWKCWVALLVIIILAILAGN